VKLCHINRSGPVLSKHSVISMTIYECLCTAVNYTFNVRD